ncbi:MAG TPA: hypothetical protein VMK65_11475, partial [Longimicrobiales bacterium]|nr:hypothetical protein [Longimicrobiales bacterium]
MNRIVMGALVLGLLMAAGAEAQSRPERRDALQQQVFRRFMEHASGELELEAEQRGSLARLLQQGQVERRAIQQELGRARRDLHQAVEAGHDADAARHLAALEELRAREYRLWEREQAALREVLTPTQHARFLMLQLRFNERVRELQQRRPGMGGRA